ncbi:MAG: hypothetical protein V7K42_14370 [Nostoc sp.]
MLKRFLSIIGDRLPIQINQHLTYPHKLSHRAYFTIGLLRSNLPSS